MRRREIELRQFLANLPLFKELGAAAVERIATHASKVRLARGATLFRRGELPTGFYVVVVGEVRLVARGARGSRLSGIVGPGRSFGEPVMFLEKPYLVDAIAHDDALLIHVPKHTVFAEIDANPRFARRVIAGLATRIDALVHELDAQAGGNAQQRLAAYLLRGAGDAGGETSVTLPATKAAVASQLGLTPEHFSRTLRGLAERGLLRVEGRRIVIADARRLAVHARASPKKRPSVENR
jgi:CRP/FNR family transcriptional regulator, dissimilatory nitrate respiration regulator